MSESKMELMSEISKSLAKTAMILANGDGVLAHHALKLAAEAVNLEEQRRLASAMISSAHRNILKQ